MSNDKIIYSSYDDEKKNCYLCKVSLKENQPRYLHSYSTYPCNFVICLWCAFNKVLQDQKDNKQVFLLCCPRPIPIESLIQLLKLKCIICGRDCNSNKVELGKNGANFRVGLQCYSKLNDKDHCYLSKTSFQKKLLSEMKPYYERQCSFCQQGRWNILKAQMHQILDLKKDKPEYEYYKKSKQLKICKKCFEDLSGKQKIKNSIKYKHCKTCDQIEMYQILPNKLRYGGIKLFDLVEVPKDWIDGQKIWKCSYCIYKDYAQTELQNSKFEMDRVKYINYKIKYQEHFMKYCMQCSSKVSSSEKYYSIRGQLTAGLSVCSFLCEKCYEMKDKGSSKFKCTDDLKNFLQKTKQHIKKPKDLIDRKTIYQKGKVIIRVYEDQRKKLTKSSIYKYDNAWPQPNNQFQECSTNQKDFVDQCVSMINHADNQSESSQYRKDYSAYQSNKKYQIQQSDQEMQEFDDDNNNTSVINNGNNNLQESHHPSHQQQSAHLDDDFQHKLEEFIFVPIQKQKDEVKEFDANHSWKKGVIEEFKRISQTPLTPQPSHQGSLIIPHKNAWDMVKLTNDPKNIQKKKSCHLYEVCHTEQDYLNLGLLCNFCFAKYLIGDTYIAEKVSKTQNPSEQKDKIVQKPNIEQSAKKNQKKNNSLVLGMFPYI